MTPTTPTGIKLHEWLTWAGPRFAGIPDSDLVARIEAEAYERGAVAGMAMERYAPTPPDALREAAQAVVDAWIWAGDEPLNPDLIDALGEALAQPKEPTP